jgi:hypothetical protein
MNGRDYFLFGLCVGFMAASAAWLAAVLVFGKEER